jgi:uncharacterized protein (DUF1697 family)
MAIFIVLLRAIGPATHVKMSMEDLRTGCGAAGLENVTTYIQTGNLIVDTRKSAASVSRIVASVLRSFDLTNHVVLRRAGDLSGLIAADPFPEAAMIRPSELAVCFLDKAPSREGLAKLASYQGPERFRLIGLDLCIDYVEGILGSRLVPSVIERWLETPATARNWNTVRKLLARAQASGA